MQIQVNSDNSVAVDAELSRSVEASVYRALQRFADRVTRVEVHLSDVNGTRGGQMDKQCLLEVRPAGRDPVAVTDHAATSDLAVKGAAQQMKRLLESAFGRLGENV